MTLDPCTRPRRETIWSGRRAQVRTLTVGAEPGCRPTVSPGTGSGNQVRGRVWGHDRLPPPPDRAPLQIQESRVAQALVQAAPEGGRGLLPHDPPVQPAHVSPPGEQGGLRAGGEGAAEEAGGGRANTTGSGGWLGKVEVWEHGEARSGKGLGDATHRSPAGTGRVTCSWRAIRPRGS